MPFGPFSPFGMRFDLPEFFVGLVAGVILTWLLIRLKPVSDWLIGLAQATTQRISESFTSGAQDRYGVELIQRAETMHSAQRILTLSEIVVPPRLLAPTPRMEPGQSESEGADALSVLPNLPDASYLSAVYAGPSISLIDAIRQGQDLMITGPLGSGKSTALAFLALSAVREGVESKEGSSLLPILIHVADIERGKLDVNDPAEPLIAAAQERASGGLGARLPNYLRRYLDGHRALILIDGLDEYPPEQIESYATWIDRLRQRYAGSQIVATGPTRGYDGLIQAGLTPLSIAPWSDHQQRVFLKRWGAAWQEHVAPHLGGRSLEQIDPALITGWLTGISRGMTPLEFTLRTWSAHGGDARGPGILDGFEAYLQRLLSPEEHQSAASAGVNWIEQRNGTIAEASLRRGTPTGDLVEAGILIRRPNRRVSFFVPGVGAYLAGQGMVELGVPETVDEGYWEPAREAHTFYVTLSDGAEEAEHYLQESDDPLRESVLRVGRWLRFAPREANWRPHALRALGKIIQDSSLPYGLRLRATHAMAESREQTATVFFRRLLESKHPSSRILGALGLGGLRDHEAVNDLKNRVNGDPDLRVRQASCLGLAGIGTEGALEVLGETLLAGEEAVRVAAAEALAAQPDEGFEMLKEAATMDELLTRRAAVFGISRVPEPWAGELLEDMQVEDSQWVVRGAAAEALEKWQTGAYEIKPPPQEISELPWLVDFASRAGLGVAPGRAAFEMLRRALNEGSPHERVAAMETIGWIDRGELDMELTQALENGESYLRDSAYEALWRQRAAAATEVEQRPPAD